MNATLMRGLRWARSGDLSAAADVLTAGHGAGQRCAGQAGRAVIERPPRQPAPIGRPTAEPIRPRPIESSPCGRPDGVYGSAPRVPLADGAARRGRHLVRP